MGIYQKQKKLGGRTSGIPSIRNTVIQEIFDRYKFDPADHILQHLKDLEVRDQVQVCVALLPYIYAKRESDSVNILMVLQKYGVEALDALSEKDLNEAIASVATRSKAIPAAIPSQDNGNSPSREEKTP